MMEEWWSRIAAGLERWSASTTSARVEAWAARGRRAIAGARPRLQDVPGLRRLASCSALRTLRSGGGRLARVVRAVGGLLPGGGRGWGRRPLPLYTDRRVTLREGEIVLHHYYLPFGAKRFPYSAVLDVAPWPLIGSRAFRVHGPGWPRVWYQRDARRAERDIGVLFDLGAWWRPVATPEEPEVVLAVVRKRLARATASGPDDERG